jgi:hypothetical membrane protein
MMFDKYTKLSGILLVSSGIVFLIFNTIAEASYPGYSISTNALSDLGALGSPTQFLWNGQLLIAGSLSFIGMLSLFLKSSWSLGLGRRRLTAILFALPTTGTIIVSLFPENYIPAIHFSGALTTFILGIASVLYCYRLTTPPFRYFAIVLGMTCLVGFALLGAGPSIGFGLAERMVVYPYVIWNTCFGSYLVSASLHD